jgi:hypothetical protein
MVHVDLQHAPWHAGLRFRHSKLGQQKQRENRQRQELDLLDWRRLERLRAQLRRLLLLRLRRRREHLQRPEPQ